MDLILSQLEIIYAYQIKYLGSGQEIVILPNLETGPAASESADKAYIVARGVRQVGRDAVEDVGVICAMRFDGEGWGVNARGENVFNGLEDPSPHVKVQLEAAPSVYHHSWQSEEEVERERVSREDEAHKANLGVRIDPVHYVALQRYFIIYHADARWRFIEHDHDAFPHLIASDRIHGLAQAFLAGRVSTEPSVK